jgi:Sel1 repeat
MYRDGKGVKANAVKALELLQKGMLLQILRNINTLSALLSSAAEAGNISAQNNIGYAFEHGKGVEVNLIKAVEWYQKGILSQILQDINTLNTLFRQPLKQVMWWLSTILELRLNMGKESK